LQYNVFHSWRPLRCVFGLLGFLAAADVFASAAARVPRRTLNTLFSSGYWRLFGANFPRCGFSNVASFTEAL
jgi:hypothetical protein